MNEPITVPLRRIHRGGPVDDLPCVWNLVGIGRNVGYQIFCTHTPVLGVSPLAHHQGLNPWSSLGLLFSNPEPRRRCLRHGRSTISTLTSGDRDLR